MKKYFWVIFILLVFAYCDCSAAQQVNAAVKDISITNKQVLFLTEDGTLFASGNHKILSIFLCRPYLFCFLLFSSRYHFPAQRFSQTQSRPKNG